MEYGRLNLPNEKQFEGAGVYYGAGSSEAVLCRQERVFVFGGSNSAVQAAIHLATVASTVTMAIRGDGLKNTVSAYLVDRISSVPQIEVLPHTEVTALHGDCILRAITLRNNQTGEERTVETRWLFLCLGGVPHTPWAAEIGLVRDEAGYLVTGPDLDKGGRRPEGWELDRDPYFLETNAPGIFAAGDVRHGSVKRYASAVGEGAMAVQFVHRYLSDG
jgi:thioredoxin reductase (NADPH)